MPDLEVGFAMLREEHDQVQNWLRDRQDAILLVRSWGEDLVFGTIATQLSAWFQENAALQSHEHLSEIVLDLATSFGLSEEGVEKLRDREVQSICVSGALVRFLEEGDPDFKRLEAAAATEFFLDVSFVAECIAQGPKASAWLELLKKTKLNVGTINDDEYMASDALEEWRKELPKAVPSWRSGDFPHRGMETAHLFSAILLSLDEASWLAFVDRLDLPMMMEAVLWDTHVERHPERLLKWIEGAPEAFDSEGKRTSSALIFVLERRARDFLEDYLTRNLRWGHEEELGKAALKELDGARAELIRGLHARTDATPLLCELAAKYLGMAATGDTHSAQTKERHILYHSLGTEYIEALGSVDEVYKVLREREQLDRHRSRWPLWLAGVSQVLPSDAGVVDGAETLLPRYWAWLIELLESKDPEIAERYAVPAQWTEFAGGVALASVDNPMNALERVWNLLSPQRLVVVDDRYAKDPWATTRYLIRLTYSASRLVKDASVATTLWRAAMEMAISAWFARSNTDPFAEVEFGLGHFSRMQHKVEDEPAKTLSYLVGLPTEVTRAVVMLLSNGMDLGGVEEAAQSAGIELPDYLTLCNDPRMQEQAEKTRKALEALRVDGPIVT